MEFEPNKVTLVITTIPPRERLLARALASVEAQDTPVSVVLTTDVDRKGAAHNRDKGLSRVTTEYVAFLDDDDALYPDHISSLLAEAQQTKADLCYPWFDVLHGTDPFPQFEGQPWDNEKPHQVPVTFLARTETILDAGGFSYDWSPEIAENPGTDAFGNRAGEDYRLILRLIKKNAKIVHLDKHTWAWDHGTGNTSGLPSRW